MRGMYFIRKLLPKTLLARFILIITVPLIIGQLAAIFLFYDRYWYNAPYYAGKLIVNEIEQLLNNHQNSIASSDTPQQYLNFSYQFIPNAQLPIKQKKLSDQLKIFKNIIKKRISTKNIVNLKGDVVETLFEVNGGIIKIVFPARILMNSTTYIIFVLSIVSVTLLFLSISVIFSKKQIESILALTEAADAFGKGVPYIYKPAGASEIRRAGIAFLKMKDRIERQVYKRTQMLAMISHDLRTPLTRMKLQMELIPDFEEKNDLNNDIQTMQNIISSYLAFAKGEGGEEFEVVNLSSWIQNMLKSKWHSVDLVVDTQITDQKVQIKPGFFERAISNLLSNAQKYGTKTKLSIYPDKSNIVLDIEDNGKGIKDEEKSMVFKPFYRSDKSRPLDNTSNVGLGLSIAKEIIAGHYGSIMLKDSNDLGGLLVRISLPIYEA